MPRALAIPGHVVVGLLTLCVTGGLASTALAQACLGDASTFVHDEIVAVAGTLAGPNRPDLAAFDSRLVLAVLMDRVVDLRNLQRVQLVAETADNDKQVGASARGEGTTSVLEQPSFAKLLALAIENGAVQQTTSSTQLTLSTSPYAFVSAVAGDSIEVYRNYELLARIGLAAGFDLDPEAANPLDSVRSDQLREWSVRVRLNPDRSGRSLAFERFWVDAVRPRVQSFVNALAGAQAEVFNNDAALDAARKVLRQNLGPALQATPSDANQLQAVLACQLETHITRPLAEGRLALTEATRTRLRAGAARLAASQMDLTDANTVIADYFGRVAGAPQATLAFTQHRPAADSAYTEAKLIYEQGGPAAKFVTNVGGSLYHDPDPARNQRRARDLSLAVGLEVSARSPFVGNVGNLSRVTMSLNARYQHMREKDGALREIPDVSVVQFRLDLPVAAGISLPLSFSMANSAELVQREDKKWKAGWHFGLTFDADKLYALTKALSAVP